MDVYERVRLCTVRIGSPSASGQGTGFFVAPGLVLTCRQVIVDDGGASLPTPQIYRPDANPLDERGFRRPPGPEPDLLHVTCE